MKNNKGFSLVELIIVIAIMAVLIGVLAPQYLKYVEKSRVSTDKSTVSEVYNAVKTVLADEDVYSHASQGTFTIANNAQVTGGEPQVLAAVQKAIGSKTIKIQSKTYASSSFTVQYNFDQANAQWTVNLYDGTTKIDW